MTENTEASKIDWDKLSADVLFRIKLLAAADRVAGPVELVDAMRRDIILPNVQVLAEFCENVQLETSDVTDDGDTTADDDDDEDDEDEGNDDTADNDDEDEDEDDEDDDEDDEDGDESGVNGIDLDTATLLQAVEQSYDVALELMRHMRNTMNLPFGSAMLGLNIALALGAIRGEMSREAALVAFGHVYDLVAIVDSRVTEEDGQSVGQSAGQSADSKADA